MRNLCLPVLLFSGTKETKSTSALTQCQSCGIFLAEITDCEILHQVGLWEQYRIQQRLEGNELYINGVRTCHGGIHDLSEKQR
jgi:hypothetical protein